MAVVSRLLRRGRCIYKTAGGGGCCHAVLYKFGCLIKRQVHVYAVHKQQAAPVLHNGFLSVVHQFVHKAVGLSLLARPPACSVHPRGNFVLFPARLFGVQVQDVFAYGIQRTNVLLQGHGVGKIKNAHPYWVYHVGAVIGCHHLVAVAGNDRGGAGTQPVNAGRHLRGVLFQQIANGLCSKHITAAGIDTHRQARQRPQRVQLIGKGLGGHFVAPPTAVRNIAVQQQFRATCRLVSKLPKLLRHGHSSCCPPGGLACGFVISSTSRLRLASITRWRILRL